MKAIIGSTNKAKVVGAYRALRLLGVDCYEPLRVDTGVEQPIGLRETVELALYRALKSIGYGGDYGVGLEGGVLFEIGYPIEGQVAVVVNRDREVGVGFSGLFPLPVSIVDRVREYGLGEVMVETTSLKDIRQLFGAVGYLTYGWVTRIELSYQATLMAITPFLRRKFFKQLLRVGDLKKILNSLRE